MFLTILFYIWWIGIAFFTISELVGFYKDTRKIKGGYYAIHRGNLILAQIPSILAWPWTMVSIGIEMLVEGRAEDDLNRSLREYQGYDEED